MRGARLTAQGACAADGVTRMFAALRHQEFRLLWIGWVLHNIGWWMQTFGLGWLVVQLAVRDGDGSRAALYLGFVGLCRAVPGLMLGLVAGAYADRVERRRLMIVMQVVSMSLTALLAVVTLLDLVNLGLVLAISFGTSTAGIFDAPARQSALSRLVPPRDMMSAIGLQNLAAHGTGVIGPAIGGLLIGPFGVAGLFFGNAAGFLPVIGALILMRSLPPTEARRDLTVLRSIVEALRYVAQDPVIRWSFVIAGSTSLLARPYLNLLPAFVANALHRGPEVYSLLLSVTGVGAVLGALALAAAGSIKRRGLLMIVASGVTGALTVVLALQTSVEGTAVVSFGLGFTALWVMGLLSTVVQTTVPERLIGRVSSLNVMLFMVVMPVGQLLLGALGSAFGVELSFALGGALSTLVAGYALWRVPYIRDLRMGVARVPAEASATAGD